MEFENMNANTEEVVQPQDAQINSEATVQPQDMDDAEFNDYIEGIKNGTEVPKVETEQVQKEDRTEPENTGAEGAKEPFRTFETEEEFQGFMNRAFGDRFKNARAEKEKYEEFGRRAQAFYDGNTPQESLEKMIEDLEAQAAESTGKGIEEYREEQRLRIDAENWRRSQEIEQAKEQAITEIQQTWMRDSENLKAVVPDFDFGKAMENENFKKLVLSGMSVASAYISCTRGDTAKTQDTKTHVKEVGNTKGRSASSEKTSPMAMSDSEFRDYYMRIKNGG